MSVTSVSTPDPTFRIRLLGFDRREVLAFVNNLLSDYAEVVRTCERMQQELSVAHGQAAETPRSSETTARAVECILAGAHRIATEIEERAGDERSRILAEANAVAGQIVENADQHASRVADDIRRQAAEFGKRVEFLREHYAHLRGAFEAAGNTAALALSEFAALEQQTALAVENDSHVTQQRV
jgi:cell division septum initiation protein DivIVA